MTHEFMQPVSEIELRDAYLEDAMRTGGVLESLAQAAVTERAVLSPTDVGNIILPPKTPGEPTPARWELVERSSDAVKASAGANKDRIFELAATLDMRQPESLGDVALARIDTDKAVWLIEGGANRTSVVRRALAVEAVQKIYGADAANQTIYQFGSERAIPKTRKDGTPNPEYTIAKEIGGDFLPQENVTEFSLNVASARQAGFEVSIETQGDVDQLVGRKDGLPKIVFVQPQKLEGGLSDAFSALHVAGLVAGKQLVIATNGQYRPKDELQAERWSAKHNVDMLPAVALGDEPGYTVQHNEAALVTAERTAVAYANEMVILQRLYK